MSSLVQKNPQLQIVTTVLLWPLPGSEKLNLGLTVWRHESEITDLPSVALKLNVESAELSPPVSLNFIINIVVK